MTLKVGYQGMPGSYSESAAKVLMQRTALAYELVPLVKSAEVAEQLAKGAIAYGVAAIENSTAGIVEETRLALGEDRFARLDYYQQPIRHCLFVVNKSIRIQDIRKVISHEQALRQCRAFIKESLPLATIEAAADTALAADNLARGVYEQDTGVICSELAGVKRDLHLLSAGVQDNPDNATTFALFSPREKI